MKNQVEPPWVLLASLVASGGLALIAQAFATALPTNAALITNVVAILVAIAGFIVQYYKAANAPAVKVLADAPVVNADGEKVGLNVSTTSTVPITAPTKGP